MEGLFNLNVGLHLQTFSNLTAFQEPEGMLSQVVG